MRSARRDYEQLKHWAEMEFAMLMLRIAVMIDRKISY